MGGRVALDAPPFAGIVVTFAPSGKDGVGVI